MQASLKTITNPMTLIAIFATLSQSSAAISLPFLDNQDREYYLWFLISFPFYLLFLFFITLNFNYRSLYSPSDFHKSKHFIKTLGDTVCRPKRSSRRTNEINKLIATLRRGTHDPRLIVMLVGNRSHGGTKIHPSKGSEQVVEHVVYVIYSPLSGLGMKNKPQG
jgi:hypothetical protein